MSSHRLDRRLLAAIVAALLLLAGCSSAGGSEMTGQELGAATLAAYTADWPALSAPATTTTSTTTTTEPPPAPLPELPVPDPLPANVFQAEPEDVVIGHITVDRLGIDEPLHQGMSLTMINRGPSHWPGTAMPGQVGNMVLAGHRTTYSRPFHDLDLIEPGDEMIIEAEGETHTYQAVNTEIVAPDDMWIADQSHEFTATTFACHPKGSARQRIVVFWQLVDDDGEPVPGLA
ncbi:MAG: sortase [Acidimicrobiales bacterium]